MTGFHSSLASDQAAVSSVCSCLDDGKLQSFVTALNVCSGTIFTSGIGQFYLMHSKPSNPDTNGTEEVSSILVRYPSGVKEPLLVNGEGKGVLITEVSLFDPMYCLSVCREIRSSFQSVCWLPQLTRTSLPLCVSCRMDSRRSGYIHCMTSHSHKT